MIKIFLILTLTLCLFSAPFAFADRNVSTIATYSSSTLVKRGDAKIYRIEFYATVAEGGFALMDGTSEDFDAVKSEGTEATAHNGKNFDFSGKPLELSTGLYLFIRDAVVLIEYE